jgi:hypothetical protein
MGTRLADSNRQNGLSSVRLAHEALIMSDSCSTHRIAATAEPPVTGLALPPPPMAV